MKFLWVMGILLITVSGVHAQTARTGVIDLSTVDVSVTNVELNGEWVYSDTNRTTYVEVPGGFKNIPAIGYGEQELLVITKNTNQIINFFIPLIHTAYEIWINDKLIGSNGVIGTTKKTETASWESKVFEYYVSTNGRLYVKIKMANFYHGVGGIEKPITIGSSAHIQPIKNHFVAFDLFLIGGLLISSVYHLFIFLFRKKDKSVLVFCIMMFVMMVRILVSGMDRDIYMFFPTISFDILSKIIYSCSLLASVVVFTYVYMFYKFKLPKAVLLALYIPVALYLGLIWATNDPFYSAFVYVIHYALLFSTVLTFIIIFKNLKNQTTNSILFGIGMLTFILCAVNDALVSSRVYPGMELSGFGVFFFMVLYHVTLAISVSRSFTKVEVQAEDLTILAGDLKVLNEGLEQIVDERTAELTKTNNELMAGINAARVIQESKVFEKYDLAGYTINAKYIPQEHLGGDLYAIVEMSEDFTAFASLDVTGHGIPAAQITFSAHSAISICSELGKTAGEIVSKINTEMYKELSKIDATFFTMALVIINKNTGIMDYANAGHDSIYVVRNNEIIELEAMAGQFQIGMVPEKAYDNYTFELQKGDEIFMYTDGIPEAHNKKDRNYKPYGEERFKKILKENGSVESKIKNVIDDVMFYLGDAKQSDDISIMGIKYL